LYLDGEGMHGVADCLGRWVALMEYLVRSHATTSSQMHCVGSLDTQPGLFDSFCLECGMPGSPTAGARVLTTHNKPALKSPSYSAQASTVPPLCTGCLWFSSSQDLKVQWQVPLNPPACLWEINLKGGRW